MKLIFKIIVVLLNSLFAFFGMLCLLEMIEREITPQDSLVGPEDF
ncbi:MULTISPECIES: hypothetical protein [unclassified Butyrivibrio]|nr:MULTISPECIES: hypothetical protein [unclassified Butyrivibrio]MDC7294391.1 hypothetical protein [Butyrivibrio sp. DSM 10294]